MGMDQSHREQAILLALKEAERCWPGLNGAQEGFAEHALRLGVSADALTRHGKDLYLAFRCQAGAPFAIQVLERDFLTLLKRVIARVERNTSFVEEVHQECRLRLLAGAPPALASYSASGPLGAWLRVSALRTALNMKKADACWRRRASAQPDLPVVRACERNCYPAVQAAVEQAIAGLDPKQRVALRLFYFDGHDVERIAEMFEVHRATIARWLAEARRNLCSCVLAHVRETLGLTLEEAHLEVASIYREIDLSRLSQGT